jgi:hypothetical protein
MLIQPLPVPLQNSHWTQRTSFYTRWTSREAAGGVGDLTPTKLTRSRTPKDVDWLPFPTAPSPDPVNDEGLVGDKGSARNVGVGGEMAAKPYTPARRSSARARRTALAFSSRLRWVISRRPRTPTQSL